MALALAEHYITNTALRKRETGNEKRDKRLQSVFPVFKLRARLARAGSTEGVAVGLTSDRCQPA